MKTIILAGGFGTRISEESHLKPKPMLEIGDKPIIWHIMKSYSQHDYNDFIICCGYKQNIIKEYFANYYLYNSDVTFDFRENNMIKTHYNDTEPWCVTLVDTGLNTMTGGRLKQVAKYVKDETFMLTYGDGVSDIDIDKLVEFHKSHGKIATISTVNVGQRFGVLDTDDNGNVNAFREKSDTDGGLINGGFMVLEPEIFEYLNDDTTILEREPLQKLAQENQLMAYKHNGFWQCMDTQRDKMQLEELWELEKAPWKKW